MRFSLKIFVLSIMVDLILSEQQCLSSNRSVGKCQDWKSMSVLVADLVGRSTVNSKVETKSNMLTLLIRAASGVIGRGTDTLKTLIVNGLVLLTQTILIVSDDRTVNKSSSKQKFIPKQKFVPDGRPIDWILKNPYIASMVDDATDESLPARLEESASGMPCVQLLVCRLSPVVQAMQRRVKGNLRGPPEGPAWKVTGWTEVKATAERCARTHRGCGAGPRS